MGPQLAPFTFGDEAANAGEMATVQCAVIKGDLPVRIAWSLNGRRIDAGRASAEQSHDTPDIVVTRSSKRISTLTIDSVAARHAGEYSCTATNEAGSATHVSVLSVNGTPRYRGQGGRSGGGERTDRVVGRLCDAQEGGEGNVYRDVYDTIRYGDGEKTLSSLGVRLCTQGVYKNVRVGGLERSKRYKKFGFDKMKD